MTSEVPFSLILKPFSKANHSTFLSLSFLISKMRILILAFPTSWSCFTEYILYSLKCYVNAHYYCYYYWRMEFFKIPVNEKFLSGEFGALLSLTKPIVIKNNIQPAWVVGAKIFSAVVWYSRNLKPEEMYQLLFPILTQMLLYGQWSGS